MQSLDPRTRLALGGMALAAVFLTVRPQTLCGEWALMLVLIPVFRLGTHLGKIVRLIWPMLLLVFIITLVSYDLSTALLLSIRLANLFTVSVVFFRAIEPNDLGDALRLLGVPFGLTFILTSGIRYVPLLGLKIRHIMDAQRSRGIDLRPRLRNACNYVSLLMPLLVQSFLLADDLAVAMEARGFGRKGRTFRREHRFTFRDWVVTATAGGLLVAFTWWERGG
jgi:energy-coupling factor transport system permease protein